MAQAASLPDRAAAAAVLVCSVVLAALALARLPVQAAQVAAVPGLQAVTQVQVLVSAVAAAAQAVQLRTAAMLAATIHDTRPVVVQAAA